MSRERSGYRPGFNLEMTEAMLNYERINGPKPFTAERDEWILTRKFTDSFIAKVLRRTVVEIIERREQLSK